MLQLSLRGALATKQSSRTAGLWIASRSLSSGAHSRDPLARNDGYRGHATGRVRVRDFAHLRGLRLLFPKLLDHLAYRRFDHGYAAFQVEADFRRALCGNDF